MNADTFEHLLGRVVQKLSERLGITPPKTSRDFETMTESACREVFSGQGVEVEAGGTGQSFPDIRIGRFGLEVKFTTSDNWRCVANSVLESDRRAGVEEIYVVYCKLGGRAEVRWRRYQDSVVHVRTSHVPRFEIDMEARTSLFQRVRVSYVEFQAMEMPQKMRVIRQYAREVHKASGRRLWWIDDEGTGATHTTPPHVRLYIDLPPQERVVLRAEAAIVAPGVVAPSKTRGKYNDAAVYLMTRYGVLCTQVRDLFSAGSVAMRNDRARGGDYIQRALTDILPELRAAAIRIPTATLRDYWEVDPGPQALRMQVWLSLADGFARGWTPSRVLGERTPDTPPPRPQV